MEFAKLLEQHLEMPEADRVRLVELATEIQTLRQPHEIGLGIDIAERPLADEPENILTKIDRSIVVPVPMNRAQRRAAAKARRQNNGG